MYENSRKAWTNKDDEQLRQMAQAGDKSLPAMAVALRRSPDAVRSHAEALGIKILRQKRKAWVLS